MPVNGPQIDRADHLAAGTRVGQPRESGCNRSANCWVEPQGSPASLTRIPDLHDLLRVGGRLALGLGALRLLGCPGGGTLAFLSSSVEAHGREATWTPGHGPSHYLSRVD